MAAAKVTAATLAKIRELVAELAGANPIEQQEIKAKLQRQLRGGGSGELRRAKALASLEAARESEHHGTRASVGHIATPVIAEVLAPGELLDPSLDAFVGAMGALQQLRAVYMRIPSERRRAIWERELAWMLEQAELGNRDWMSSLAERFAFSVLDVAPEATPFILAYYERIGEPWRVAKSDGFARTRGMHPSIEECLAEWERQHPDVPKAPEPLPPPAFPSKVSGAPYIFIAPAVINKVHWNGLGKPENKQLVLATERMLGEKPKSGRDLVRILNERGGGAIDDFELRRWYICDAAKGPSSEPLFDAWVFGVDNAVFFRHATVERVQVYVLQGSFMADDDQPASAELAAALDASAPRSIW